uniref:Glycoside hydrolase family 3 N-terminal domain-containing protein n=1 Tax=Lactuca sativa TaxID=4236 RepID=A0A9R1XX10_LACSA|nr:hypothetical protein LSAT_V11C200087760 [Lactuca sativa]
MAKLFLCVFTILAICSWATATIAESDIKYKDPKQPLGVRIRDLMNRMTLEEKIGQMTQIDSSLATLEVMRNFSIGSLLTTASTPSTQDPPEAWINMVNNFQRESLSSRLGIPLMDVELVKKIGAATALEIRATGINYAFAPCVAVCRDPRWGRCFESFGEDPNIVRAMTEFIPGLQGSIPSDGRLGVPFVSGQEKVASCAKHYVGDGGTTKGINANNTVIDFHGLLSIHMPPYFDAGFVISDFMGIDQLTNPPHANYTSSIQQSIMAGIDMAMIGSNYTEFIDGMTFLVKNNSIPMSRIDDAVRRILRVKFVMGLFENPFTDLSMAKYLGEQDHRDLAREAVRKSLVLLKNGKSVNQPMLPLPKKLTKILVAGTHANDIGYQCGGWTIEWAGKSGNTTSGMQSVFPSFFTYALIIISYMKRTRLLILSSQTTSYAIVVTGEFPYSESAGDSQNLTIPEPGPTTIMNVCVSVKCVVVLISGRPVVIEPYVPIMDALVAAWLPGTEGQGVADVLFGDYGFTGKLANTWFKTVDQLPMNVGDSHYDPLYPLGYGLTIEPTNQD